MHRATVFAVTLACPIAIAGPLSPPAGPVAPTNKTLQQVEPRTPIAQGDIPLTILDPGSYYLSEPVTSGGVAIVIGASGVTLDLNGYSVGGTAVVGDEAGIVVSTNVAPARNTVRIFNGHISGFQGAGIDVLNDVPSVLIENVQIADCGTGIRSFGYAVIARVVVRNCSGDGISLVRDSTVSDSLVIGCAGNGFDIECGAIRDCAADNNALVGFLLGESFDLLGVTATGCTATANDVGFSSNDTCVLERCVANGNNADGYLIASAVMSACIADGNGTFGFATGNGAALTGCTSMNNGADGFVVGNYSVVTSCTAIENATDGFDVDSGSTMTSCTAHGNGFDGYEVGAGCTIASCTAYLNDLNGFDLSSDCSISFCTADGNGEDGIEGNSDCRIDSNLVTDNVTGIVSGTGSLVIRNSAAGNTGAAYNLVGANAGPVATDAATATSPWANFEF